MDLLVQLARGGEESPQVAGYCAALTQGAQQMDGLPLGGLGNPALPCGGLAHELASHSLALPQRDWSWCSHMLAPQGFAPQGFAPQGFAPQGFAPQGFAPQGFAPLDFAPLDFAPLGYAPLGFAPQGFTAQVFAPQAFAPQAFAPPTIAQPVDPPAPYFGLHSHKLKRQMDEMLSGSPSGEQSKKRPPPRAAESPPPPARVPVRTGAADYVAVDDEAASVALVALSKRVGSDDDDDDDNLLVGGELGVDEEADSVSPDSSAASSPAPERMSSGGLPRAPAVAERLFGRATKPIKAEFVEGSGAAGTRADQSPGLRAAAPITAAGAGSSYSQVRTPNGLSAGPKTIATGPAPGVLARRLATKVAGRPLFTFPTSRQHVVIDDSVAASVRAGSLRGVSRKGCKWQSRIRVGNVLYYLGMFDLPEDAGLAYDQAACLLQGPHALLNFPEPVDTPERDRRAWRQGWAGERTHDGAALQSS
jgi:hypothetical protein